MFLVGICQPFRTERHREVSNIADILDTEESRYRSALPHVSLTTFLIRRHTHSRNSLKSNVGRQRTTYFANSCLFALGLIHVYTPPP